MARLEMDSLRAPAIAEPREILVPHATEVGPVTAVKNLLIQGSLALLRACGYYERYVGLIDPDVLGQLLTSFGPGWVPIELADVHYAACDKLSLSSDELAQIGQLAGHHLQETTLISAAKKHQRGGDFDYSTTVGPLYRMWGRLNQGGSVQVERQGPRIILIEQRGFTLNRHRYYREAGLAAVSTAVAAAAAPAHSASIESFSASGDELVMRLAWT